MDIAATFPDDAVTDAEAEARAFADGLRRIEGVEGAVQVYESRAGIIDAQCDAITFPRCMDPDIFLTTVFDGVNRIAEQIEENLLQFVLADSQRREKWFNVGGYFDALFPQVIFAKLQGVAESGLEISRILAGVVLPREPQQ